MSAVLLASALLGCPAHRYPDGNGLEGQLEREVIALTQENRMLEARVAGCEDEGAADPLYRELYQVFRDSEVEVEREGGVTVLTVRVSHLYSDPYRLEFRGEATGMLDLVATALALHPQYRVMIIGHVDDRPIPAARASANPSPLDLSVRLAHGVADRLVHDFGVARESLGIGGRGPWDPRQSNDLEAGRDANQRIELWISPPTTARVPPE